MAKFRKKPVVIEAFQMTAKNRESNENWPQWAHDAWNKAPHEPGSLAPVAGARRLTILTLEGIHDVIEDDWIVRGIKGELYPVKPDIFEATYEPVGEPT